MHRYFRAIPDINDWKCCNENVTRLLLFVGQAEQVMDLIETSFLASY